MSEETQVWSGSPSQVTNMGSYITLIFLSLFLVTLPFTLPLILWIYLVTKNQKYELTTQRLKTHVGVLSKNTNELELYRVTDTQFYQSFWLRLFGLGNVVLISTDRTSPKVVIKAVKNASDLRERIRNLVEVRRDRKLVREIEFN